MCARGVQLLFLAPSCSACDTAQPRVRAAAGETRRVTTVRTRHRHQRQPFELLVLDVRVLSALRTAGIREPAQQQATSTNRAEQMMAVDVMQRTAVAGAGARWR